jgi:predicted ATPase/DNA-binding SARP family transcriptional activator
VEVFDGTTVVRLPRAERTVLAALAARVGERVPVDVLEEALWPSRRPPSARKSMQGHIARLRRALGRAAIVERGGGYRLDRDHVGVDAERVAGLVAGGREAIRRGDLDVAVGLLAEARVAFRGDPYEDVSEAAVPAGEVQRLQELRATMVEEAVEAELARGGGERCIGDLEAFLERNTYRERAWGQLMHALYQAGRSADALAAYGRARMLLAAELGLEPGPALQTLQQSILTHDPRLLTPAATSGRLGPSNLPVAVSPIIGRQLQLAVLEPLIVSERLVTLTGVGGIGKTRLAIELATRTAGSEEFGPFFVDLAPIGDVELVPAALATALGVQVEPNADVTRLIRAALGDHSVVVVVDNCEHLLPGIAALVDELVGSCPGIRVLAASRESLGVAGERVCPVDPLQVPPVAASLDQIEGSDAGALLLARLPMNRSTGPLGHDELAAVGMICRSLDGIPLGLELAAARSRTLSLPELADRLERSIDELAPIRHGVMPRHRTMRAALDWGYELLTPSAQAALRAMSVFAGGCDLSAFAAVCHDDEDPPAVDVLDELVRTSFATVDFTGVRTRYGLLEPVRQYARELADKAGDAAARRDRHLHYYEGVATSLTRDIDGHGVTRFDELRCDLGNFRVALDWAAGTTEATDAGLSLASRLWELWTSEARHEEGLSRIVGLLSTGAGSASVRSEAAYFAGFIASDLGDDDQTLDLAEQALAEAQAGGDGVREAHARRVLCSCIFEHRGDLATARRHIETALQIATDEANDLLHAKCMLELANFELRTGSLDEASNRIQQVLDGPAGSDSFIEMYARGALGETLLNQGVYAAARTATTRTLALAESTNRLPTVIGAHLNLAAIECAAGADDDSAAHIAVAEELNPDTAHSWDPAFLIARTDLALARGQNAEALGLAEAAIALEDESYRAGVQGVANLRYLGDAQLAVGNSPDALATFQQLITRASDAQFACRLAEGHEGYAAAAEALGNSSDAHEHLTAAREIRRRTRSRRLPRPAVDRILLTLEGEPTAPVSVSGERED